MTLQLTIKELLHKAELKISLKAGRNGLDRTILWAHTSELENPSKWVLPHYLIMTTGLGIPKDAEKQRQYLQYLVDAELAGLLISDHMNAPTDLEALYEKADEIGFPILMSDYNTPFINIAKVISEANKDKKESINHQLIKVLYEHTRSLIKEHNINDLVNRVRALLNFELYLIDLERPTVPPFPDAPYPDEWQDTFSKHPFSNNKTQRLTQNGVTCTIVPLKAKSYALAIIDQSISNDLLQNLILLFSFYIEGRKENFSQLMKLSNELFDDILHERVNESYVEKRLPNFRITPNHSQILIFKRNLKLNYETFFFNHAIYGILISQKDHLMMLTDSDNIPLLSQNSEAMGISNPLESLSRLNDAIKEAKLAYKKSSKSYPIQYYAEDNYAKYGVPKSLEDAKKLFDLNLGALYQQDQERNTRYLTTLKVFLDNDRAWEKSAKQLHIHKQTLVYRMQKIQEITGRKTDTMEDIVELWIALKAGEILGLIEESH
ncbi:PucR family transcriptional regulator ligand-binding domain-containing protein [Ignatzschineria rhizosphaerae]|uniref:PucR family transcriptional regulator ligand-binding domain-containing protein n=1 Tax=Ignatzschineria rhizosphaerae TaxID=2923279 RepID=A0ABY3X585_9GAMM|nr:PucR family transcriptional regulator [Ignatzschineria rhizosphaerae]UNM96904.1 PucR family transcriptional regulator ligand-binding domain-containing protein [Ignatzschineria rhizosphaerae]